MHVFHHQSDDTLGDPKIIGGMGGRSQQDINKQAAGLAALDFVTKDTRVIGLGTGSTVKYFTQGLPKKIQELGLKDVLYTASSVGTEELAREVGINVTSFNDVVKAGRKIDLYVDGADEVDGAGRLIKGGGAALAREKVLAYDSRLFVCVVDESKVVQKLGRFPLPVEVLPIAEEIIASKLRSMGGKPVVRMNSAGKVVTDNGNILLDVAGLDFSEPVRLERDLKMPGVVENGVFALKTPQVVIAGKAGKAEIIRDVRKPA